MSNTRKEVKTKTLSRAEIENNLKAIPSFTTMPERFISSLLEMADQEVTPAVVGSMIGIIVFYVREDKEVGQDWGISDDDLKLYLNAVINNEQFVDRAVKLHSLLSEDINW